MGYLFQKLVDDENIETKATQLMWDIMITTDPEFLSDGYRVQFQRVIDHETGEEEILDVTVEHATLGFGCYPASRTPGCKAGHFCIIFENVQNLCKINILIFDIFLSGNVYICEDPLRGGATHGSCQGSGQPAGSNH